MYSFEDIKSNNGVGNVVETGQKENLYFRTAKNSCQKYVFGRMYGKQIMMKFNIFVSSRNLRLGIEKRYYYTCVLVEIIYYLIKKPNSERHTINTGGILNYLCWIM